MSRKTKTGKSEKPAGSHILAVPVVGIGASAGGLEALEQFLKNVSRDSGVAYVIIQHLDPDYKGIMPELLQRTTSMNVSQVKDRIRVQADSVYVIPPNKDMSILHGVLHLLPPVAPRGLRLPIDFFFRSLAQDQKERSIGVILSGMGSDGTLGLRAIKDAGGLVLVQDPASAKFDGMPRSVVEAGLADVVDSAEKLPEHIDCALHRKLGLNAAVDEKIQAALEKVVILLRTHTGHDFSLYKRNTLYRRVERRMGVHRITRASDYVSHLQENSQELDLLFKELLIGVTSFFRDTAVWENLCKETIPALIATRASQRTLRAWVPGCSTGEEAYSLAIVLKEAMEASQPKVNFAVQIFATDLDREAIDKARQGLFPGNIAKDVSAQRLNRFFIKEDPGFRVCKEIREMVIFASQNLIMDAPFTRLDILSCRNLLIYLAPEIQRQLFPLFHYSLVPSGILLLGSSESIGDFSTLFTPVSTRLRIFRRSDSDLKLSPSEHAATFLTTHQGKSEVRPAPKPPVSLQTMADQMILQRYAPPSVLVNDKGDIIYVSGRTGKYLEPAAGKANWNIFVMAREELRYELSSAFQKVLRQDGVVAVRAKLGEDFGHSSVDITVQRFESSEPLGGLVMILFTEIPDTIDPKVKGSLKAQKSNARSGALEREVQQVRMELQAARLEMQTSQEELRSANEELQSTNEELQSTNEELSTSKEEMQSLNEELQTVNAELQAKVEELSGSNNDMKNLFNSTDIATVFLDNELRVRRFTDQATKVFKFIPGDVGRPIADLATNLNYTDLAEDVRMVLRTRKVSEKPMAARNARWFSVRIMPYRGLYDQTDGVVMTFTDITAAKNLEKELRATQAALEKRVADQSKKLKTPSGKRL